MNEDDDIDGLAAEYVLGSLDAEERKAVADYLSRLSPNLSSTRDEGNREN